jgi:CRP/FNR family transcriptional regulator, cyclic AMP receptor protein
MTELEHCATKTMRKVVNGEYLFRQNDETKELYIIKKGSVRIFKVDGNSEINLDTVGPGSVIGEIAIIDGGVRSASGIATMDTEVIVVSASEFRTVFKKMPEWFQKIALILVQRLREVNSKINQAFDGDRLNHVAAIMSLIAATDQCCKSNDGYEISSKFLENELVDILNLQPAEVVTILDKLEKQGIIRTGHSKITILFKNTIEKMAQTVFEKA